MSEQRNRIRESMPIALRWDILGQGIEPEDRRRIWPTTRYLVYLLKCLIGHSVRLEASSLCQLRCPSCSTRQGDSRFVGQGYLKFKDFKRFVDNNPSVWNIELSCWGEIFLNPELTKIIEYAAGKGIVLAAGTGVNLNNITESQIEALVRHKFLSLSVSIDGATNETYRRYRREGNLHKVLKNIERINNCKKKNNSKYPRLRCQFIIFGHNENEINHAKRIAKALQMDFRTKLNRNPGFYRSQNTEAVRRHSSTAELSRAEYQEVHNQPYAKPCYQLWISPQINWDGRLLGCCANNISDFGNVFKEGFENLLSSKKYQYAKRMVLGQARPKPEIPCTHCMYLKK